MIQHPTLSPAGAARERAVPCQVCRRPIANHEALCDEHLPRTVGRQHPADRFDLDRVLVRRQPRYARLLNVDMPPPRPRWHRVGGVRVFGTAHDEGR